MKVDTTTIGQMSCLHATFIMLGATARASVLHVYRCTLMEAGKGKPPTLIFPVESHGCICYQIWNQLDRNLTCGPNLNQISIRGRIGVTFTMREVLNKVTLKLPFKVNIMQVVE